MVQMILLNSRWWDLEANPLQNNSLRALTCNHHLGSFNGFIMHKRHPRALVLTLSQRLAIKECFTNLSFWLPIILTNTVDRKSAAVNLTPNAVHCYVKCSFLMSPAKNLAAFILFFYKGDSAQQFVEEPYMHLTLLCSIKSFKVKIKWNQMT